MCNIFTNDDGRHRRYRNTVIHVTPNACQVMFTEQFVDLLTLSFAIDQSLINTLYTSLEVGLSLGDTVDVLYEHFLHLKHCFVG